MPMLRCYCPNPACRAEFLIPDDMHAKESRCPKCRARLRLSSARGQTMVVLIEAPTSPTPDERTTTLYVEPPKPVRRKRSRRAWLIAEAICFILICCCGGFVGLVIFLAAIFDKERNSKSQRLTATALEKRLAGLNMKEVRAKIGEPFSIPHWVPANLHSFPEGADVVVWIYRELTVDSVTGKPDPYTWVWFHSGKVAYLTPSGDWIDAK